MKRRSLLSLTAGASLLAGGCAATKTPPATAATDSAKPAIVDAQTDTMISNAANQMMLRAQTRWIRRFCAEISPRARYRAQRCDTSKAMPISRAVMMTFSH